MLAIGGQSVAYLFAVVVARALGVEGFEAYVVASAAFILMVTFAPRGFDKQALGLLPALLDRADWGRARGYLAFSIRRILWTSLFVGVAVATWALCVRHLEAGVQLAIIVSCVALPAGALAHLGLEVLTALGRVFAATAIFRVAVPSIALVIFCVLLVSPMPIGGAAAVGCWAVAWMIALAMMAVSIWRACPPEALRSATIEERSAWERGARIFWIYRVSVAVLGQASVIALDSLQPFAVAVGAYVAASATAGLAHMIVAATNRVYARQLSVLLERRDFEAISAVLRRRLKRMAVPLATYLIATLVFTRELIWMFRPEFVDEGVVALRVLAAATAFIVVFSLAPTYLKFRSQRRAIYSNVAIAAGVQITLLLLLVPHLGAAGAAIAYSVAMCGLYGNLARLAYNELAFLKRVRDPA
jgi:hypothetical protein